MVEPQSTLPGRFPSGTESPKTTWGQSAVALGKSAGSGIKNYFFPPPSRLTRAYNGVYNTMFPPAPSTIERLSGLFHTPEPTVRQHLSNGLEWAKKQVLPQPKHPLLRAVDAGTGAVKNLFTKAPEPLVSADSELETLMENLPGSFNRPIPAPIIEPPPERTVEELMKRMPGGF